MIIRRAFTKEEDEYLISNHGKISNLEISQNLHRTKGSIENRIKVLGISKRNIITQKEKEFICNNYHTMEYQEIGKILNRSPKVIQKYLKKIGKKKILSWENSEIEKLKELVLSTLSHEEISKILNRSISSINSICSKMKITNYHYLTKTRIYKTWQDMRARCYYIKKREYHLYGGRGITVCDEWDKFINFYNWAMANGYQENLTIERVNVNGNYCPENCRWATQKEQCNNTRRNIFIEAWEEVKTIKQWSEDSRASISASGINRRLLERKHLTNEEIISLPPRSKVFYQ